MRNIFIENEIIALLIEYCPYEINIETRIFHDLFLYGDDADEFLVEYKNRYSVDFSKFDFNMYFPSEGDIIFPFFIIKFFRLDIGTYKELKVKDLVEAVKVGFIE